MINKLLYLLEEQKIDFSEIRRDEIISLIRNELIIDDLYIDPIRTAEAINGQDEIFYCELAIDFVEDLNEFTELYFIVWEPIFSFLNNSSKTVIITNALTIGTGSDSIDYINGIFELENDNYELALFHFNNIDDYVANYFKGICYFELENFENSIKQYEIFIETLIDFVSVHPIMSKEHGIAIAKWNVYNDLGYAYNRLSEFKTALSYYDKTLELFSIEENYKINRRDNLNNSIDDFTIFANNYLLSLEKNGRYESCKNILRFFLDKEPHNLYYQNKLIKIEDISYKYLVFNNLFKPKKPFNISSFRSTNLLSREKSLEDMIVEQIKYGLKVFNKEFEIYQDNEIYGRQYRIPGSNGILDLFLIDKKTNELYVVELKRNEAGIEVVEQIENYIIALSKQLNKPVRGIICLHKTNDKLRALVNKKQHIDLFTYKFDFTKE